MSAHESPLLKSLGRLDHGNARLRRWPPLTVSAAMRRGVRHRVKVAYIDDIFERIQKRAGETELAGVR